MDDEEEENSGIDWIDEALKKGMGFKSEEERSAYIKNLGDPEMHPMFARNSSDLIGNPLADGIRALREEDKTDVELAIMYKDEGNELLKNNDFIAADGKYSYSLTFLDKADEARINGSEPENDRHVNLKQLRSQILGNQAQICLNRKNYKSTIQLSEKAISVWNENIKAHYRICKSLLMLRRFEMCIEACEKASKIDATNKEFTTLANTARDGIKKAQNLVVEKQKGVLAIRHSFESTYDTIQKLSQLKKVSVNLGFGNSVKAVQLKEVYPSYNITDRVFQWPLLFLYPQYNQLDVIPDANVDGLIVEYLAHMFPEYDDDDTRAQTPVWDKYHEFEVSKLVVYIMLHSCPLIQTKEEWFQNCLEERILNGAENQEMTAQEALEQLQHRQSAHEQTIKKFYSAESKCRFIELHIGCSILNILNIPNHVLSGGVINCLVYAKGNVAHQKFLKSLSDDGFTEIGLFGPNRDNTFQISYTPL